MLSLLKEKVFFRIYSDQEPEIYLVYIMEMFKYI